ncbi:hypothetical protein BR93DRAFT_87341 [Coniochaeta sp. PMI_546]|nr:hypothetical protein BR93DRAFT_87341 [Coniochaeta sp. PMI_546]
MTRRNTIAYCARTCRADCNCRDAYVCDRHSLDESHWHFYRLPPRKDTQPLYLCSMKWHGKVTECSCPRTSRSDVSTPGREPGRILSPTFSNLATSLVVAWPLSDLHPERCLPGVCIDISIHTAVRAMYRCQEIRGGLMIDGLTVVTQQQLSKKNNNTDYDEVPECAANTEHTAQQGQHQQ